MARSIADIQASILTDMAARPELADLNSTSTTALYRLITFVVAMAIATLENLQDAYRIALFAMLVEMKPHTLRYYQGLALAFRPGVDLLPGEVTYPDNDVEPVVRYASVREVGEDVQIKVAKDGIEPLTGTELAAFTDYMNEVKDAGVRLTITSQPADVLKLSLDVYYNPQILDVSGRRIDGSDDEVVRNAIIRYTEALRFDGLFVTAGLIDELQRTEGIQIPTIRKVEIAQFGDPGFAVVGAIYPPVSGFVRLYSLEDLTVNYISYADA